jgi:hypothetical protein
LDVAGLLFDVENNWQTTKDVDHGKQDHEAREYFCGVYHMRLLAVSYWLLAVGYKLLAKVGI